MATLAYEAPMASIAPGDVEAQISLQSSDATSVATTAAVKKRESADLAGCRELARLLTPAQWLYLCWALAAEIYLMWFYDQVPGARIGSSYIVVHLMLFCLFPRSQVATVKEERATGGGGARTFSTVGGDADTSSSTAGAVAAVTAKLKEPKERDHSLDNVKVFCTVLVLNHHITGCFGGDAGVSWAIRIGNFEKNTAMAILTNTLLETDQSFFMCLLFFISGIFTPSSFERKGMGDFIRDKVKRLGWPVVITFFCVTLTIGSACSHFDHDASGCCAWSILLWSYQCFAFVQPGGW